MNPRFRDETQQRAVCDRVIGLAQYDLDTERLERLSVTRPDRVRRARTLLDLALALYDDDSHLALSHLIGLDADTRSMIADLLGDLGMADHDHIDRWLRAMPEFAPAEGSS